MNGPNLSVITGLRNRPKPFQVLLDSIQRCTDVDWELIVGDASDAPITDTMDFPPNVIVLPERPRLGHSRGYNRCFEAANAEWVVWLNDDAEVLPKYASSAIAFMERNPQIGIGCLSYSDDMTRETFHVNTCCYGMDYANFGIISRSLGQAVGWFDEQIPMYGADNSLAYRVLLGGFGIGRVPGEHIIHHSQADLVRFENNNNRMMECLILLDKYGPKLEQMRETYERTRAVIA